MSDAKKDELNAHSDAIKTVIIGGWKFERFPDRMTGCYVGGDTGKQHKATDIADIERIATQLLIDNAKRKIFSNEPDLVEVVRCKDCKYYNARSYYSCYGCALHSEPPSQYYAGHEVTMDEDDFCSYGERK